MSVMKAILGANSSPLAAQVLSARFASEKELNHYEIAEL
jgi:hypothetical protein